MLARSNYPWCTFLLSGFLVLIFHTQNNWINALQFNKDPFLYNILVSELLAIITEKVIKDNEWWRLFTFLFVHTDKAHLYNNLVFFVIPACFLEIKKGPLFLLSCFFSSCLGGAILSIFSQSMIGEKGFEIGCSGGVFGVVFSLLFIRAIELTKTKGKWIAKIAFAAIVIGLVYFTLTPFNDFNLGQTNITAHQGGAITGILFTAINMLIPKYLLPLLSKLYFIQTTLILAIFIFKTFYFIPEGRTVVARYEAMNTFLHEKNFSHAKAKFFNITQSEYAKAEDYIYLFKSAYKEAQDSKSELSDAKSTKELKGIIFKGLSKFPDNIKLLELAYVFFSLETSKAGIDYSLIYGRRLAELEALNPVHLESLVHILIENNRCKDAREILNAYYYRQEANNHKTDLHIANLLKRLDDKAKGGCQSQPSS